MGASQVRELCDLAVSKKIEPDSRKLVQASIWSARKLQNAVELAIVNAASGETGEGASKSESALWICNGRKVSLEADGQPLSPRHVQALELIEGQYDIGNMEAEEVEDAEEEPEQDEQQMMMEMMMGGGRR